MLRIRNKLVRMSDGFFMDRDFVIGLTAIWFLSGLLMLTVKATGLINISWFYVVLPFALCWLLKKLYNADKKGASNKTGNCLR